MNDTQIKDGITLFDNRKEGHTERQPVMKGIVRLDGAELEVALWPKVSAKGTKYWSGTIAPKQERMKREPKRDEFNERIPF